MGASPSKDERLETVAKSSTKNSHYDSAGHSFDGDDESMLSPSQENMANMSKKIINNIGSPRTSGSKLNGYGAQNRVDRQLASDNSSGSERRDDIAASAIADDQVQVNLAMADLMAYLQVVANNSNNLPITRRDDPELGRMVSTLSSEEYARKSAAFVPADVRFIGGSFSKYGRVWDLPTGEEYNASDGAQEPGRSYGGACCNAMLKVLYDSANEATDAAQTMAASEALFDDDEDDDDESLTKTVDINRNSTFASIDMNDHSNPATTTWAELLRKMKAEIHEIEYAQTPTISATRKFDLNQPFSFTPESFDPKTGKKRSLLIGCNYTNISGAELKASHDDVRSMKDYIVNVHGFPESEELMTVLIDDEGYKPPTHTNITEAFKALSEQSLPGDAVFIQFSGHGGRVLDSPIDTEAESYDEVIVPCDYPSSGLIRDTLMFKTLLAPMRYGVTVTILIDCCDTGMMLELPYSWTTRADRPDSMAKLTLNDDFSFVRFLKVVKTLYESSTFTQLGKTVGSALNTQPLSNKFTDDDTYTMEPTLASQEEEDETAVPSEKPQPNQGTMMTFLAACASPGGNNKPSNMPRSSKESLRKYDRREIATVDTRDTRAPSSLLEQVINCTYVHGDDPYSDDDTYHTKDDRSYGEHTLEDSTFDSMTDDGYESNRRRARPRRKQV